MVSIAADGRSGRSTTSSTGSVAARGEGGERGAEAVVEHRRVDAAGQVAQLGDGLLGAAVGGVDQLQDPLQVGLRGPVDHAAELLPGQPQLHGDGDHLRLRPVVQVPLDPAQPRGRVVHHVGPGLLQLTHPADAVLLQAVDGPEDQRRPRQRQRCQPGSGPSQWTEASRRTPRTTLKMPQATRTPTQRRGRRYSHDLTRNLMRTGREEGTLSAGACIGMPPVTCSAAGWPCDRNLRRAEASPQAGRG